MAVVAAILFFTSLLGHELGHAVTARHEGMELDGIKVFEERGWAQVRRRLDDDVAAGHELVDRRHRGWFRGRVSPEDAGERRTGNRAAS
jgi:hypothetical protein